MYEVEFKLNFLIKECAKYSRNQCSKMPSQNIYFSKFSCAWGHAPRPSSICIALSIAIRIILIMLCTITTSFTVFFTIPGLKHSQENLTCSYVYLIVHLPPIKSLDPSLKLTVATSHIYHCMCIYTSLINGGR